MSQEFKRQGQFLSLILRHQLHVIGLTLDKQGWTDMDELLAKLAAAERPLTRATLEQIVATNHKQRFRFDDAGQRIRANQGHSVDLDLGLPPCEPPEWLFHGTSVRMPSRRFNVKACDPGGGNMSTLRGMFRRRSPWESDTVDQSCSSWQRCGCIARASRSISATNTGLVNQAVPPEHLQLTNMSDAAAG